MVRPSTGRRPWDAALGLVLDQVLGDPPTEWHPVGWWARVMRMVEASLYADDRLRGLGHAAVGTALGAGAGSRLPTAAATSVAVAGRSLWRTARDVGDALDRDDLADARRRLPALVGREPDGLDAKEVARAVVESVAENTVDAIVAPALWGALAGGAGALGYRAVNTLDAMVGHRSDRYHRYGWASARLDDAANFVPARLTVALVALVRPARAREVWRTVRSDAPGHPSPNAGVVEAAFAAALGLRLGGVSRYGARVELRPSLGAGRPAEAVDIGLAIALSRDVCVALGMMLVAWGWFV